MNAVPRLTHEQSCIVRMWLNGWLDDMADCYHLLPAELFDTGDDDDDDELACDRCRQARAAYDAEWVTVRRNDVQAIIDIDDSGDCAG